MLAIGMPGWTEIILILLVVLILFGAKRIPDIAQGLGRGIRDFRHAVREGTDEIKKATELDEDKDTKKESNGAK
jgi:sec-independent protein translocase protein TatA